jgi:hypothetical protein
VTHENKDKKIKKSPVLKNKFVFRDELQNYNETAYLLKSPNNAIRLIKSIESLKEGRIVETSLSELTQK